MQFSGRSFWSSQLPNGRPVPILRVRQVRAVCPGLSMGTQCPYCTLDRCERHDLACVWAPSAHTVPCHGILA
jgi:hypothetical protein